MRYLLPHLLQQLLVHPVVQIAQHDVGLGPAAHLVALHGQMGVPDAAADEGGVVEQRLHKAVVGAPEDLAVCRLLYAPGGVLLGVDEGRLRDVLHQKQRLAHEHAGDDVLWVTAGVHLGEGDKAVNKGLHVRDVLNLLGLQGQPKGVHPLQNGVVSVAVQHPYPGLAPADAQVPGDEVIVPSHAQHLVKVLAVLVKLVGELFHSVPPCSKGCFIRAIMDQKWKTMRQKRRRSLGTAAEKRL